MVCRGRGGGRSRPPLRDRRPRSWPGSSRRGRRRSLGGDERPLADLPVRPALGDQGQHLRLSPGQAERCRRRQRRLGEADLSTRSSSRGRRPRPARASRSVPRWTMAPIRWASRSPTGSWWRYRCADTTARRVELHRAPYRRITVREPTLWRGDPLTNTSRGRSRRARRS